MSSIISDEEQQFRDCIRSCQDYVAPALYYETKTLLRVVDIDLCDPDDPGIDSGWKDINLVNCEDEKSIFHNCEDIVNSLEAYDHNAIFLIYGAFGSGKTSLLRRLCNLYCKPALTPDKPEPALSGGGSDQVTYNLVYAFDCNILPYFLDKTKNIDFGELIAQYIPATPTTGARVSSSEELHKVWQNLNGRYIKALKHIQEHAVAFKNKIDIAIVLLFDNYIPASNKWCLDKIRSCLGEVFEGCLKYVHTVVCTSAESALKQPSLVEGESQVGWRLDGFSKEGLSKWSNELTDKQLQGLFKNNDIYLNPAFANLTLLSYILEAESVQDLQKCTQQPNTHTRNMRLTLIMKELLTLAFKNAKKLKRYAKNALVAGANTREQEITPEKFFSKKELRSTVKQARRRMKLIAGNEKHESNTVTADDPSYIELLCQTGVITTNFIDTIFPSNSYKLFQVNEFSTMLFCEYIASLSMIIEVSNNTSFKLLSHVGSGTHSHVFLAQCQECGFRGALKIVPALARNDPELWLKADRHIRREICFYSYMQSIKHPHIVRALSGWKSESMSKSDYLEWHKITLKSLIAGKDMVQWRIKGYCSDNTKLNIYYILMPYYGLGNLRTWLQRNHQFSDEAYEQRLSLFRDILTGVEFLHENDLIHRRLCPDVILLEDCGHSRIRAVIGGLGRIISYGENPVCRLSENTGLSRRIQILGATSEEAFRELFEAPEVKGTDYDKSCDYYSIGVIALQLFWNLHTRNDIVDAMLSLQTDGTIGAKQDNPALPEKEFWLGVVGKQVSRNRGQRYSCLDLLRMRVVQGATSLSLPVDHRNLSFNDLLAILKTPLILLTLLDSLSVKHVDIYGKNFSSNVRTQLTQSHSVMSTMDNLEKIVEDVLRNKNAIVESCA